MLLAEQGAANLRRDAKGPSWCSEWAAEVSVLLICGIVIPVSLAISYGSLNSPAADDWSYDLATFHLALRGVVNLNHWGTVNAVGEMVLATPLVWIFGPHVAVLNVWTSVVGFGGLVAVNYLLRKAGSARWAALAAAAALTLGPMWAALSTSFMTDIPSFAIMMIALAVAVSDIRTDKVLTRRTAVALLLGAVAFTIREPTGIAFVAIAAGRAWRCSMRTKKDWLTWGGFVAAVGLISLVFYVWRRQLSTTGFEAPPVLDWRLLVEWYSRQWLLPLLGLMLLVPVLVSHPLRAMRAAWSRHRGPLALLWLALVAGPWVLRYRYVLPSIAAGGSGKALKLLLAPPLGNWYFSNTGDAMVLHPIAPVWGIGILGVVASLSWLPVSAFMVLAGERWHSERHDEGAQQERYVLLLAVVSAIGSMLLLTLLIVTTEQMWDRYLLPVAGPLMVIVSYGGRSSATRTVPAPGRLPRCVVGVVGVLAFVALVVTSLAYTVAMDGWDGSEWEYSVAFAQTIPQVPAKYIFTNWLWNSMQAGIDTEPQYHLLSGYRPCWVEVATNGPMDWTPDEPHPKIVFRRVYRTWVATFRYEMESYEGASARASCHMKGAGAETG